MHLGDIPKEREECVLFSSVPLPRKGLMDEILNRRYLHKNSGQHQKLGSLPGLISITHNHLSEKRKNIGLDWSALVDLFYV